MNNYWIRTKSDREAREKRYAGYLEGLTITDNLSPISLEWYDSKDFDVKEIRDTCIELKNSWHILAAEIEMEGKKSWENAFTSL